MIDIKMNTDTGDLVVGPNGDLELVYGDEAIIQQVIFRLKTTKGDWLLSPEIGASLEDFIGQPNTELTLALIQQRVIEALTLNDLLLAPDVRVISLTANDLLILVEFASEEDDRIIQVQANLDLNKGLVFLRVDSRTR